MTGSSSSRTPREKGVPRVFRSPPKEDLLPLLGSWGGISLALDSWDRSSYHIDILARIVIGDRQISINIGDTRLGIGGTTDAVEGTFAKLVSSGGAFVISPTLWY